VLIAYAQPQSRRSDAGRRGENSQGQTRDPAWNLFCRSGTP
jgi:hypothetical protein